MELEFQRDHLHGYETVLETTLCQEETMEAIVPDACPDIRRIVDCRGQAFLTGKLARPGQASANGVIRVALLYQPDDDAAGLRRMEISLPFSCQSEAKGLTEGGTVFASARLRWMEGRALNPRKVLLRVDLAVDLTACQSWEERVCGAVTEPEECAVRQLTTQQESYQLTAVQERPFMFSEQLRLSGGGGEAPQVLAVKATPVCAESKLIGTKLVFKGSVEVQLLLQDGGGGLSAQQESLPFSQVMEVAGVGENGDCQMAVELTDLTWAAAADDGRSLEVNMELLAQAKVWQARPLTLLQDLYSTSWNTEVQTGEQRLRQLVERAVHPQNVRELLETGAMVRSVVDCTLALGEVQRQREGEQLVLTVQPQLTVLYLDENETPQTIQRSVTATCRVDCPENADCSCRCLCPGEVFAAPAAGGAEVRFTLEFHCMILSERRLPVVTGGRTGEARPKAGTDQPSVILRLAAPGETLWDIAKSYGTTTEQIAQANELEGDAAPAHTMLLIPSVR